MRNDDAAMVVVIVVVVIALAIALAIAIMFYLTLMRCLQRIQPRNRDMEPAMVWLNLVPCLGIVWIFITVSKIGSSLEKEFRSRRWSTEGEGFGTSVGIAYAALSLAGAIPYIGVLFSIASLVCFIIYWVQIAGYSSRLANEPFDDRRRIDDFDDDFDRDRPAPPPREPREGPSDERIRRWD